MTNCDKKDFEWMRLALKQASLGRRSAPPNPWVGCALVKEGKLLSTGYHVRPGTPHAEALALQQAGDQAKGATCYVTLEPCAHHGKTPPCADALIHAGIFRVVIASRDPDPRVSGKGIEKMRQAGIEITEGVCEEEVSQSLTSYLHHRKTGLPYVVLKVASSLDGSLAAADSSSKWITGEASRQSVQELRADSQAILIGAQTAIQDLPRLTARSSLPPSSPPVRCVVDPMGKLAVQGPLFDMALAPTWIFTTSQCPQEKIDSWRQAKARVSLVNTAPGGLDLHEVLHLMGQEGILQLLVEGGGRLLGSFVQENLFDLLHLFLAPKLLGNGIPTFQNLPMQNISQSLNLSLYSVQTYDEDVCLTYRKKEKDDVEPS